jgi:hypothetical protein
MYIDFRYRLYYSYDIADDGKQKGADHMTQYEFRITWYRKDDKKERCMDAPNWDMMMALLNALDKDPNNINVDVLRLK